MAAAVKGRFQYRISAPIYGGADWWGVWFRGRPTSSAPWPVWRPSGVRFDTYEQAMDYVRFVREFYKGFRGEGY